MKCTIFLDGIAFEISNETKDIIFNEHGTESKYFSIASIETLISVLTLAVIEARNEA